MERVYLLLRDNEKQGPYTIDELIQHKLDKNDLIWVEGRSLAWAYPSEIDELRTMFIPAKPLEKIELKTIQPFAVSKIYTRPSISGASIIHNSNAGNTTPVKKLSPEEEIEYKAEEIRKRALFSSHPGYLNHTTSDTEYKSPLYLKTDQEIDFKYHKKRNFSASLPQLIVIIMATSLVAVGWYGGWTPLNIKKGTMDVVATPFSGSTQAAPVTQKLISETENAAKDSVQIQADSTMTVNKYPSNTSFTLTEPAILPAETTVTVAAEIIPVEKNEEPKVIAAENKEEVKEKPVVKINSTDTVKKQPATKEEKSKDVIAEENEPEKKKGFLRKLFKKKNKDDNSEDDKKDN